MAMPTREATVQKRIADRLRDRGAWVVKCHQSGWGKRGVPDLIACYRGVFVAIECKAPAPHGAPLTPAQKTQLLEIHGAGGASLVATAWDDVAGWLDHIDSWQDTLPTPRPPRPIPPAMPKVVMV